MGESKVEDMIEYKEKKATDLGIEFKWMALCVLTIFSYMLQIANFGTGLDSSGLFAVNYFFDNKIVFGRDVYFSYGPLGFLCQTMNVGNNLIYAMLFWLAISAFFAMLWYQILCGKKYFEKWKIVLAIVMCVVVECYASPEYFLYYIFFLALFCSMFINRKNIYICDILIVFIMFIKFSALIGIMSGWVMFILLQFIYRESARKIYLVHAVGSICASLLFFIIFYAKSVGILIDYIRGGLEVSEGYGSGMSIHTSYDAYITWVLFIVICYFICLVITLLSKSESNTILLCVFLAPLFMMYKHGFVRADGHVFISFQGMLVVMALIILFFDFSIRYQRQKIAVMFGLMIMMGVLINDINISSCISTIKSRTVDLPKRLIDTLQEDTASQNQLPEEIVNRIGTDTATIYPWNILYLVNAGFKYVPMPAVQNYCAYTPFLDRKDADFFKGDEAPQYIVMSLETIDNRWPMVETPQTWREISTNYYVDYYEDGILLLKQRETEANIFLEKQGSYTINKQEQLNIQGEYLQIDASLSILGKIAKLFWRVPEVTMTVEYASGKVETHRILLDNLSTGVDLSSVPYDIDSFIDYVNLEGKLSKVKGISFSGRGLRFYKNNIVVTSYKKIDQKINKDNIQIYASEVGLDTSNIITDSVQVCIDSFVSHDNVTQVKGWAFLRERDNQNMDIYVCADGKFYLANKEDRSDVANVFGINETNLGFNVYIDKNIDDVQICIEQNGVLYGLEENK